jgi:hypothetical protein
MRFTTTSGSLYEVDTTAKKIRRLNGEKNPTPRMGKDGEWRHYAKLYPAKPAVGQTLVIVWGEDTPLLPETVEELAQVGGFGMPITHTSLVVKVDETVYN